MCDVTRCEQESGQAGLSPSRRIQRGTTRGRASFIHARDPIIRRGRDRGVDVTAGSLSHGRGAVPRGPERTQSRDVTSRVFSVANSQPANLKQHANISVQISVQMEPGRRHVVFDFVDFAKCPISLLSRGARGQKHGLKLQPAA